MKDTPKIEMYNRDCMELMAEYPDNYFDLAIVDPPYGINAGQMRLNNVKYVSKKWDSLNPNIGYLNELFRVSKNQIIWGGNYFRLPPSKCFVVWDKKQPEGVSFSMAEMAWLSFDENPKVFYQFPSHVTQGKRIHPTQKPVALYKWLLANYAKEGDKILDTHGGSGSICLACHDLGFDLVWTELDPDYYADAVKRYEQHAAQLQMF